MNAMTASTLTAALVIVLVSELRKLLVHRALDEARSGSTEDVEVRVATAA
jgi:hypothetical protein